MMRVLAGLELEGATLTMREDAAPGGAWLGEPVWSPARLLADIELRLGLTRAPQPRGVRVASWQARLLAHDSPRSGFYARSLAVDPLGTAETLLALRDSLVEAGWDGEDIPDAGERLRALAALERLSEPPLPAGPADRLRATERALAKFSHRIYDELRLAEPGNLWPLRWQRIFTSLARSGTRVIVSEETRRGAGAEGDLQRLQSALGCGMSPGPVRIEGDGSFVLLTGDTSWEAARATAALLGELEPEHTVVIREGDHSALDHALASLGLPTQGLRAQSPYRGALQILPLALELSFEPRDPYRVLELLTAPCGPFQGRVGRRLAYALSRSPGIGGAAWELEKLALAQDQPAGEPRAANDAPADDVIRRIGAWLEGPTADAITGASKVQLLQVVERVQEWLRGRVAGSPQDGSLLAAAAGATAFRAALERDSRARLDLLEVRKLSTLILGDGNTETLVPEQSGRLAHVERAPAFSASRRNLVWWFFVDVGRRPERLCWRHGEVRALRAAGVHFVDPRALLFELSRQRRRALLSATERVVLVAPRACARDRLALDPLWNELRAAARLDDAACNRLTVNARQLLDLQRPSDLLAPPRLVPVQPAALPGGHTEWRTAALGLRGASFSATSLEALLACPLRWVLSYPAKLRSSRRTLPPLHQLTGTLGHRLVEVLHQQGAFEQPLEALEARARVELADLLPREGALLSRLGASFERSQVEAQLVQAVVELARSLRAAHLSILAVERPLRRPWRGGELEGRVDLIVGGADGHEHILDLKYGSSRYRDALKEGRAVQLAVYCAVHAHGRERATEAAFFSLKQARFIGLTSSSLPIEQHVQGRSLEETWAAVERTMDRLEDVLPGGAVPVTGLRRSLPLLDALRIGREQQPSCFSARRESICDYCQLDVLCGRRWEGEHEGS